MWLPLLPEGSSVHQAIAVCLNCTTMQQCMEKLLCRAEGGSKNKHKKSLWYEESFAKVSATGSLAKCN